MNIWELVKHYWLAILFFVFVIGFFSAIVAAASHDNNAHRAREAAHEEKRQNVIVIKVPEQKVTCFVVVDAVSCLHDAPLP